MIIMVVPTIKINIMKLYTPKIILICFFYFSIISCDSDFREEINFSGQWVKLNYDSLEVENKSAFVLPLYFGNNPYKLDSTFTKVVTLDHMIVYKGDFKKMILLKIPSTWTTGETFTTRPGLSIEKNGYVSYIEHKDESLTMKINIIEKGTRPYLLCVFAPEAENYENRFTLYQSFKQIIP